MAKRNQQWPLAQRDGKYTLKSTPNLTFADEFIFSFLFSFSLQGRSSGSFHCFVDVRSWYEKTKKSYATTKQ